MIECGVLLWSGAQRYDTRAVSGSGADGTGLTESAAQGYGARADCVYAHVLCLACCQSMNIFFVSFFLHFGFSHFNFFLSSSPFFLPSLCLFISPSSLFVYFTLLFVCLFHPLLYHFVSVSL